MSQLHLLPLFFSSSRFVKNTRSVFSCHYFAHAIRQALFIVAALIVGSCEKKNNEIVDSTGAAPFLPQVTLSPSEINSDSINVASSRQPDDLLPITTTVVARVQAGYQLPISVNYSIVSSDSLNVVSSGALLDNGQSPDFTKGDGFFSGKASFQIRRSAQVLIQTANNTLIISSYRCAIINQLCHPVSVFSVLRIVSARKSRKCSSARSATRACTRSSSPM